MNSSQLRVLRIRVDLKDMVEAERDFNKNIPYKTLRLNLSCNARCLFCNVPPGSGEAEELNTEQAKKFILDSIHKGYTRISITGGEPTIRTDLPVLIKYALENGAKELDLQTNALLLENKGYVKRLKKTGLKAAFVALHSHLPKVHNILLGHNDAYRNCIKGIRNLLDSGIKVYLNPVVNTLNYKFLSGYMKFVVKNFPEIKSISLSVIQPHGRAWKNKFLVPRHKLIDPFVEEALGRYSDTLIVNNPICGLPFCIGGWWRYLPRCVEFCINYPLVKKGLKAPKDNNKTKLPVCKKCDLEKYCNGVWRRYLSIYPFVDARPLRLEGKINPKAVKE